MDHLKKFVRNINFQSLEQLVTDNARAKSQRESTVKEFCWRKSMFVYFTDTDVQLHKTDKYNATQRQTHEIQRNRFVSR